MIQLKLNRLSSIEDAQAMLQTAIGVEFGTLPPYLYALLSIPQDGNPASIARIRSVVGQEMIHMCLACNILNALGGDPILTAPVYPGPLPGDIGPDGVPLTIHLLPFSPDAMKQGMEIEQPEEVPDFPIVQLAGVLETRAVTIGQFYAALDDFLATLPDSDWHKDRHQIVDNQFFAGQLFAINGYADAHRAIQEIVSEGEGAKDDPLDFQHDIAHYYRFGEMFYDKVLTKSDNPTGYAWGPDALGVDWGAVYPAIPDPGTHDFSQDSAEAQAAQTACNQAYTDMVDALQAAVTGTPGALGEAVRAMFDLRMAAFHALNVKLADETSVAGPSFLYTPILSGASS